VLFARWVETPLGPMLALGDDAHVHLVEFAERRGLEREVQGLRKRLGAAVVPGATPALEVLERELADYFAGHAFAFTAPHALAGSEFQRAVWRELLRVPAGETRTYAEVARALGRPSSARAVARAVGANCLALVVPCHRVVGAGGALTGYAGGLARKRWLLEHERRALAR